MSTHLEDLVTRHPALTACRADIAAAFALLRDTYRRGGTVLICGNGGSAADAEHWAGELLKGFGKKRSLAPDARKGLSPELAERLQGALPVIPLTGFLSLRTAFANDVDARLEYAQLVWGLGRPGDVFVGLSTSGNAANVCLAAEAAKAKGLHTLGLTGASGGKLRALVEVCVRAPETRTHLIQELHLPIYHALCLMLEDEFFPGG